MTTPAPAAKASGNVLSIIGIVCGVIALGVYPIIFGIAGVALGLVARARGERWALIAVAAGAVGLVVGLILSYQVNGN